MSQPGAALAATSLASPAEWLALACLLLLGGRLLLSAAPGRRGRQASRAGDGLATCGKCGYAVAGLPTFTCPECGSDLREVGIVRGNARPGGTRLGGGLPEFFGRLRPAAAVRAMLGGVGRKLVLFAAVYAPAAYYGVDHYVDRVRPTTTVKRQIAELFPGSGAYKAVTVTLTERWVTRGRSLPPGTPVADRRAAVDLLVGPDRFTFVRDVVNGENLYRDRAGGEQRTKIPLSQALTDWMTDHGVDAGRPGVRDEIALIANAITQSGQPDEFMELMANHSSGYFNRHAIPYTTYPEVSPTGYGAPVAVAAAVGLAGFGLIGFTHHRGRRPWRPRAGRGGGTAGPVPGVRTLSVMFSDVKDYTARTAGESRLGILDVVRRHAELAEPVVARRGGRVVKSLGDGLLIAFDSGTDAVLAGLELQAAAAAHNAAATAERDTLHLRVAVSTGEVAVVENGDVFGEAVNLASRAQQQAPPGEVWFTEATRATVNRNELRFAEAGTFDLKGIPEPVRLYRAVPQPVPAPVPPVTAGATAGAAAVAAPSPRPPEDLPLKSSTGQGQ